jgi:hypothetical protein
LGGRGHVGDSAKKVSLKIADTIANEGQHQWGEAKLDFTADVKVRRHKSSKRIAVGADLSEQMSIEPKHLGWIQVLTGLHDSEGLEINPNLCLINNSERAVHQPALRSSFDSLN